jgi:hypothetical protein
MVVFGRIINTLISREIIKPLKGWYSSNILEQTQQIKIPFRKELRVE